MLLFSCMNEDLVINKLIEIDQKLGSYATNARVDALEQRILQNQDEMLVILKRLDEERHFTVEWVRRIEADVDRIKTHLQIA